MTAKRNAIVNALLAQIRAATTTILATLDDDADVTRGPSTAEFLRESGLMTESGFILRDKRVIADVFEDAIEPCTLSRETHVCSVGILVLQRATTTESAIENVVEFADEVERAIYDDRTLGGEADDAYCSSFSSGCAAGDTDFIAYAALVVEVRFQTYQ